MIISWHDHASLEAAFCGNRITTAAEKPFILQRLHTLGRTLRPLRLGMIKKCRIKFLPSVPAGYNAPELEAGGLLFRLSPWLFCRGGRVIG